MYAGCSATDRLMLAPVCWLLAADCWLLAAGSRLLAPGCWVLAPGCWLQACLCMPECVLGMCMDVHAHKCMGVICMHVRALYMYADMCHVMPLSPGDAMDCEIGTTCMLWMDLCMFKNLQHQAPREATRKVGLA